MRLSKFLGNPTYAWLNLVDFTLDNEQQWTTMAISQISLTKFHLKLLSVATLLSLVHGRGVPDSKVHGANMGPTWVLSAPDGPHVGPMNLANFGVASVAPG